MAEEQEFIQCQATLYPLMRLNTTTHEYEKWHAGVYIGNTRRTSRKLSKKPWLAEITAKTTASI